MRAETPPLELTENPDILATISKLAADRARVADVRGVQQLLVQLKARDLALGGSRPDAVNSIVALVEEQLDAARRAAQRRCFR